ncbi:Zinc_finger domain-containing protein [Hexamita inflata]|uniref:Zinc finger domain-containing protein n=1 Tax=Hexamita inflata TaxID=28002 RepID=A0AA86UHX1_9EUKA|nr:Zinc finger domain-containing protein [Hexamita inflata]
MKSSQLKILESLRKIQFSDLPQEKIHYCSTFLERYQLHFQCDTCGSDLVIFCSKCFLNNLDKHKGHVTKCITGCQGMCDCGQISALAPEHFCPEHQMQFTDYTPEVLQYFYNYVIHDEEKFTNNYCEAVKLTKIIFMKEANKNIMKHVNELINSRPYILRIIVLVFFFDGQKISVHDLFLLQSNLEQLSNFQFEYNETSYMVKLVKDQISNEFCQQELTKDFLFKYLLAQVYQIFAADNTSHSEQLCGCLVQALCEPYSQIAFKQWNFIQCLLDKIKQCADTKDEHFAYQFFASPFGDSPIFCHSLLHHKNAPQFLKQIAQIHATINQSAVFCTNKQYKKVKTFMDPLETNLDNYRRICHSLLYFSWYLQMKQNLNYDQLLFAKYNLQAKQEDCYNYDQLSFQEFINQHYHHIEKLQVLVQYYHENNYFCLESGQVSLIPIYILQVYLARICDIFQQNPEQLIGHLLISLKLEISIADFVEKLFYNWIRTIAFLQMIHTQQYFKKYIYDLLDLVDFIDQEDMHKIINEQVLHAMRILLPLNEKSLNIIYNAIFEIDDSQQEINKQIYLQIINMIIFLPSPYDKQQYIRYLLATKHCGVSYNSIIESELDDNFRLCEINKALKEIFEVKILDPVAESVNTLHKLEYVEPALSNFNQEHIINKFTQQQVKQLSRIIDTEQYKNLFQNQFNAKSMVVEVLQELSQKQNSISNQVCILRLCALLPDKIDIQFTNILLQEMYQEIFHTKTTNETGQKLSMKDKYKQLKQKQNNSDTLLQQIAKDENNDKLKGNEDNICQKCHLEIGDKVFYPFTSMDSCFGGQIYRTCGHKFHNHCFSSQCPVCQKYFQMSVSVNLNFQAAEELPGFIVALNNMKRVLELLASEPLIIKEHKQKYVTQYLHEVKILSQASKQLYNSDLQIDLPDDEAAVEYFAVPNTQIVHSNALTHSNFEYLKLATTESCAECQEKFQLTNELDFCVCLHCGQYIHFNCEHSCEKLLYDVLNNELVTSQYKINGYYRDEFGGLNYSCVGPELFLNKEMLSQILVNLITGEAVLQPDQNWVIQDGYSEDEYLDFEEEEEEEFDEM